MKALKLYPVLHRSHRSFYFKFMLVLSTLSLMACNNPSKVGADTPSPSPITPNTGINVPSKLNGSCNQKQNTTANVQLKEYTESGVNRYQYISMKINSLHADIAKPNYQLRLFKWRASGSQTTIHPNPLKFKLSVPNSGDVSNDMTALTYADLNELANRFGTNDPMAALRALVFKVDLEDPNGDWLVLRLSLSENNAEKMSLDILIPAFYANPSTYESTVDRWGQTRATALVELHPFVSVKGQNQSDSWYVSQMNSMCF